MSTVETPSRFGRYVVRGVLGRGAMGVVYKAHDPALERDVAVKVVATELLGAEERADYLDRFRREARAAARCAHRGIVAVYDFAESEGRPYIVMELVDGTELGRILRARGRLPLGEAAALMMQMLDALGHAHALGIVHRDVKPANVLVLHDGAVKIADFGVARLGELSGTQVGTVIGTPKYMAPEQAMGQTVDHRADLFAAAAIFHEMLTGAPAFGGATADEIIARVVHGPADRLAMPEATPALQALLDRALAKDPEHRLPNAAAFAAALRQMLGATPVAAIAGAAIVGDATRIAPAPSLDARAIEAAEKALATHIGPIARVLVRKAAGSATTERQLYETIAPSIPDEATRIAFLRGNGVTPSARGGGGSSAPTRVAAARAPIAPEAIAAAEEALTFFIGPIARVIVRKAADRARSSEEFYEALATHLPGDAERAAFRRRLFRDWQPRLAR